MTCLRLSLSLSLAASQAQGSSHPRHARVVRALEEDTHGQEAGRGRGGHQAQGDGRSDGQAQRSLWTRDGAFRLAPWHQTPISLTSARLSSQFSFNPDMFEDEEEDDEDAWDLENYRQAENAFSDNDDDAEGAADKLALLDVDGEDEDESEAPSAGEVDLEGVGGQSKGKEKAQ